MALPRKYRKCATFLANVTLLQNEYHSVEACTLLLLTRVQNLSICAESREHTVSLRSFPVVAGTHRGDRILKRSCAQDLCRKTMQCEGIRYKRSCPRVDCVERFAAPNILSYLTGERSRSVQYRLRSRPRRKAGIII